MNVSWDRQNFGGISMELPDYLYVSEQFSAPGKIFLENENREIYLIIERRHRSEIFSRGMEFRMESLGDDYDNLKLKGNCSGKYKESETGELPGGGNLYSMEGIIQCEDSIFLIQASTTADSRKGWYRDDFLRIFNSFDKQN